MVGEVGAPWQGWPLGQHGRGGAAIGREQLRTLLKYINGSALLDIFPSPSPVKKNLITSFLFPSIYALSASQIQQH